MKVMEIGADWDFEHIRLAERPDPRPGQGQVLLRMKAASLNYRDALMVRRGYGNQSGSLPLIPISDGVGEVIELGPGVDRVAVGQRVCPLMNQHWLHGPFRDGLWRGHLGGPLDGVMREFMVLDQEALVPVPDHLSDIEAATLPCAGITAWSAIVEAGRIKAGDQVLVQGTGGVSLFALQFAKAQGATVIATSSSEDKLARLTELGADAVINYRTTADWGKAAAKLTDGRGVDLVVETGGAQTIGQSIRALRANGTIALVGNVTGSLAEINLPHVFMKSARLIGVVVGNRDAFEAMVRAIAQHQIAPVVDPKVYGFEELRAALEALPLGRHIGKIALRF
ncbi:MAG: NAD(P)-dependent alcohol dehydrogenase [Pseudomonadota bacterium]